MEYYHLILFIVACAIAVSAAAPRVRIPYPIILMLSGVAIGFIPEVRYVPIEPEIVFLLFLPPLLYDAAVKIPFREFRRDIGTISMLAVTMVFITMAATAVTLRLLMPEIS